jgi:hypothetical protein
MVRGQEATAVLLSWKRPQNIPRLVSSIRSQTVPIKIVLWNNAGDKLDVDCDLQINCSENMGCFPRWYAAALMGDAPYVFSLDDDMCFADDGVVEDCIKAYKASTCRFLGYTGVRGVLTDPIRPYSRSAHFIAGDKDERVDIIKGRFLFFNRSAFYDIPMRHPEVDTIGNSEDDIIMSLSIAQGKPQCGLIPSILKNRFIEMDASFGLADTPGHNDKRDRTADKLVRYYL